MSTATELIVKVRAEGSGQLTQLQNQLQNLAKQSTAASVNFSEVSAELKKIQSTSANSINNLKGYSAAWREIANSVEIGSTEFKQANIEIKSIDNTLKSLQGTQAGVAKGFRDMAAAAKQQPRETPGMRRDPFTGAYSKTAVQYGPKEKTFVPDIGEIEAALNAVVNSEKAIGDVRQQGRIDRLNQASKINDLEIEGLNKQAARVLQEEDKIYRAQLADFDRRLEGAEGRRKRAAARLRTAGQVAGITAAASIFGGPEAGLGAAVGGVVGGVPGANVGAATGAVVAQARQALSSTAELAASLEKQRTALRLVIANTGQYNQALAFLDKASKDYAIPQDRLVQGFTQLAASVLGAGGNIEDTKTAFEGITAGVRGTAGSLENLDGALLATAQVFSKGKVSAEELRGQIGERLPGAFTLFADAIGKTPAQLDKALKDGEVSLLDFLKFTKSLYGEYGENAKIIAAGPAAAGDRLQKNLTDLSANVGKLLAPIGASFQDTFSEIIKFINAAAKSLNDFLGLNATNAQKIGQLNNNIITSQKALARTRENLQLGNISKEVATSQAQEFTTRISQLKGQLGVIRGLEKATAEQKDRKGLPGATDGTGDKGGKGAAAAAAREAASDLKDKNKLARELKSLTIQNSLLYYKEKQYSSDLNILEASAKNDQKEVDRLGKLKLADAFEEKIYNIIRERNKALQESAENVDQTNRAGRDQVIQQKSVNDLLEARLDIVAANKKIDIEAAIRTEQQNLDIGKLTDQRAFAIGLITKKEFEAKELEREKLDIVKQFSSANKDLVNDYIDLINKQAELKNSFGYNFVQPLKAAYEESQNLGASLGNVAVSAVGGLTDAFVNFAATGKASFGDFARSVLLDLSRIFARMAILQAVSGIFKGFNFGGGGGDEFLGGAVTRLLGHANGNVFAQNGIVPFAYGGIVDKPTMFPFAKGVGLMGEAGPEAIMPLRRGSDGKLGVAGGGGTSVVVNVDATGSNAEGNGPQAQQLGKLLGAAVQAELIKQKRPGGLLA